MGRDMCFRYIVSRVFLLAIPRGLCTREEQDPFVVSIVLGMAQFCISWCFIEGTDMCRWGIGPSRVVGEEKRVARHDDPNASLSPSIEEPNHDETYQY